MNTNEIREVVFLSHASPEDNEFTRWLAAKLTQHGYRVFCDLLNLWGGEDFWRDAENSIRTRAAKFVYVLSRVSNEKLGPRNELGVATNVAKDQGLSDFIIPILIDDLPASDVNIELARLNVVSGGDWAAALRHLLTKLEHDSIPRQDSGENAAVTPQWWDSHAVASEVVPVSEQYLSNWFPILAIPESIFVHRLCGAASPQQAVAQQPYPAVARGESLISFADTDEIPELLPPGVSVVESSELSSLLPVTSLVPGGGRPIKADSISRWLIRLGFERLCLQRGLRRHKMANGLQCRFFPKGLLENDTTRFSSVHGRPARRKLVGFRSVVGRNRERRLRYWHFGVHAHAAFEPMRVLSLTPHVLFSNDGHHIWPSKARLHAARRSQCKDWWNDDWRDRLLGTMAWLGDDNVVSIRLSGRSKLEISTDPVTFESPVTYREPKPVAEHQGSGAATAR